MSARTAMIRLGLLFTTTFVSAAAEAQGGVVTGQSRQGTLSFTDLSFADALLAVSSLSTRTYATPLSPSNVTSLVGGGLVAGSLQLSTTGVLTGMVTQINADRYTTSFSNNAAGVGTVAASFDLVPLAGSRFGRFVRDGYNVLRVQSTVSISSWQIGAAIDMSLRIPGDWSSLGTLPGQVTALTTTLGWNVTESLTFSGGFTTLRLADSYAAQSSVVSIGFELIGSAIPNPGCGVAMAGAAVFALRRRRS